MGTKVYPGSFDCYRNAEPDEPVFVLLGRDKDAPALVELWAEQREKDGENAAKVAEARNCAASMREYRQLRMLGFVEKGFITSLANGRIAFLSPKQLWRVYPRRDDTDVYVFDTYEEVIVWGGKHDEFGEDRD